MSKPFNKLILNLQDFSNQLNALQIKFNDVSLLDEKDIVNSQQKCSNVIKQIMEDFKNTGQFTANERMRINKYKKEFESQVVVFKNVCSKIQSQKQAERNEAKQLYQQRTESITDLNNETQRELMGKNNLDDEPVMQDQQEHQKIDVNLQREAQLAEELLKEKQQQLDNIEREIYMINDIQKDINNLVIEGGQNLDIITANLEVAKDDTTNTNKELKIANELQKSNTKKYMIIVTAIILIVTTILLIVFLS